MKNNKIGILIVENILQELNLLKMIKRATITTGKSLHKDKYIPLASELIPLPGAGPVAWTRHFYKYPKTRKQLLATARKIVRPKKWLH